MAFHEAKYPPESCSTRAGTLILVERAFDHHIRERDRQVEQDTFGRRNSMEVT